jgi:hypothetical protein
MKLEFTDQQLTVLDSALAELPYRVAAPLIQHINHQIHEQRSLAFDERRGNPQKLKTEE